MRLEAKVPVYPGVNCGPYGLSNEVGPLGSVGAWCYTRLKVGGHVVGFVQRG